MLACTSLALSCLLAVPVPTSTTSSCADGGGAQGAPAKIEIAENGLSFEIAGLTDLAGAEGATGSMRRWNASLDGREVAIVVWIYDATKETYHEPEDAVEAARDYLVDAEANKDMGLAFEPLSTVRTTAGASPLLARTHSSYAKDDDKGDVFLIGGLVDRAAWALALRTHESLDAAARAKVEAGLAASVRWTGKPRDPKWTDAEAKAYFERLAPPDAKKKYVKPIRTEHFILLSSHASANQYAKKLEAWYADIAKTLPFEESNDRRLLPVLLFRHDEEYRQFYADVENLKSKVEVEYESWCGGSWYATHFDNDSEWDNRFELTKFLLINRMRAWGACLWFRAGLREYCATRANEREDAVRAVRKKRHTPLEKLLDEGAWGERTRRSEKTGVDVEADYWDQACLWMEFLRESKATKGKFADFVRAMAGVADGDVERVRTTITSTFGCDVPELERRYFDYCTSRK